MEFWIFILLECQQSKCRLVTQCNLEEFNFIEVLFEISENFENYVLYGNCMACEIQSLTDYPPNLFALHYCLGYLLYVNLTAYMV